MRIGLHGSPKRKKQRPTHWTGVLTDCDNRLEVPVEVGKLPTMYCAVEMPPPGIINDLPLTDVIPESKLQHKGDSQEINSFARELDVGKIHIEGAWYPHQFYRLLAKIAHAYMIKTMGTYPLHLWQTYLEPIILGKSGYYSQYIGGIDSIEHELQPPNDLGIRERVIRGKTYVSVTTTLFGHKRLPTYEIIAAQLKF